MHKKVTYLKNNLNCTIETFVPSEIKGGYESDDDSIDLDALIENIPEDENIEVEKFVAKLEFSTKNSGYLSDEDLESENSENITFEKKVRFEDEVEKSEKEIEDVKFENSEIEEVEKSEIEEEKELDLFESSEDLDLFENESKVSEEDPFREYLKTIK